ncbi:hypothetical protein LZ31DRAFT_555015 [Colletotrichum somersetense]|nr:hypothetical protein LZ31DRAFT_555015 [Colletotrichum somersetense]
MAGEVRWFQGCSPILAVSWESLSLSRCVYGSQARPFFSSSSPPVHVLQHDDNHVLPHLACAEGPHLPFPADSVSAPVDVVTNTPVRTMRTLSSPQRYGF